MEDFQTNEDLEQTFGNYELVIIGAGLTGIIAAQRYLEAHPKTRLTILEKDECVGGVFRRLYNEFWTQWTYGLAEFSDMPMEQPPSDDLKNACFRAKYTTEYLEKYVDEKIHDGRSLRDRIQFSVAVERIEKIQGNWHIHSIGPSKKAIYITASKLMVANGGVAGKNFPDLPDKESFEGRIVHSEDFGESNIISSKDLQHIVVIGAGKSSADIIYESVKAGKTVSWIISTNGTGPGFFAPLDMGAPGYKNAAEAAQTRLMSSLQPSLLNDDTKWTRFLHSTSLGNGLVNSVFGFVDKEVRKRADYSGRKSTKGFEKLAYDTGIFWQNGTGGALHHDDFWQLIADNVTVHRDEIKSITGKTLYLKSGSTLPCDAVLCGTGWNIGAAFFTDDQILDLGLPHPKELDPPDLRKKWDSLILEADKKVVKRFHELENPPPHTSKHLHSTPYRMYNTMAPLSDDSILFMNHITAGNKLFAAEAQAIWAVAYFDRNFTLPPVEQREEEIATWIAWNRRRYLSNGESGIFASFDSVPYVDKLLRDIGLTAHRKGWWSDLTKPFKPTDLGLAWREYLQLHPPT